MSDYVTPSPQAQRHSSSRQNKRQRKRPKKVDESHLKDRHTWQMTSAFSELAGQDEFYDLSMEGDWLLSSCVKVGDERIKATGIFQLLHSDADKHWQTEGQLPHSVLVTFNHRISISFIAVYLDAKADESYTPKKVAVQLGTSLAILDERREFYFENPEGWQYIDLRRFARGPVGLIRKARSTFVVRFEVQENHENGRDSRIRHLCLIGPCPADHRNQRHSYPSIGASVLPPFGLPPGHAIR